VVAFVLIGGGDDGGGGGGTEGDAQAASGGPSIETTIDVAGFPVGLAIHDNLVSVATREGSQLVSYSKESEEQVGKAIDLGGKAEDVAVAGGSAWVTIPAANEVERIRLDADGVPEGSPTSIPVGAGPRGIVASEDAVWVADLDSAQVTKIDAKSGKTQSIDLPSGSEPTDIAFDAGTIWVSDRTGNAIKVPFPDGTPETFPVGDNPKGIGVFNGDVWIANTDSGSVWRLDADGNLVKKIDVGGTPRGLAVDAPNDLIWVANGGESNSEGWVDAIDATSNEVQKVDTGPSPEEVAIGPLKTWATTGAGDGLVAINP
jgi:streptogramin lyase